MAVIESKVRRGRLTIDGQDHSCQPSAVSIVPENTEGNAGDELELLCGDKIAGDGTSGELSATLQITAVQDFTDAQGLIAQSWKVNGTEAAFVWRPTESEDDAWSGKVKVSAITVGGEVGQRLTSDVSWTIAELTLPTKLGGGQVIPAPTTTASITGVTAGAPGSFSPGTASIPGTLAELKAHGTIGDTGTAKPTVAWTTGQYVTLGDASKAYWDGSAWVVGTAP
jgi:hypothetical protein